MNKNEFYLVSIEYGRDLSLECGNVDYAFISNNKDIIIREFMQGLRNELDYSDCIMEDNRTLEEVKEDLTKALEENQDFTVCFYKNIDEFKNGYELFSYVCALVERKIK